MSEETPESGTRGRPLLSAMPPIAKRLNRNALLVVAAVMGLTVLVAVVTTHTTHPHEAAGEADPVPPPTAPPQPSFLDRHAPEERPWPTEAPPSPDRALPGGAPGSSLDATTTGPLGPTTGSSPVVTLPPAPPPADPVRDAYRRALTSPVVAAGAPGTGVTADASGHAPSSMSSTSDEALLNAILGPMGSGGGNGPANATATPRASNPPGLPRTAPDTMASTRVTVASPRPNQLDAGTVIPAALATAINSDLPGHLLAYVTRNVYDSRTQRVIVIPQGTKLIGEYNNTIAGGQHRLLIAWTRLIFPTGVSVTLPGLRSTDATGASGVPGDVDNHLRRVFGNALLLSVMSAGIQLSQPRQGNVYAPPTAGQVAAGAVGQQLGDVATEIVRRNLDIPPTITLTAGTPFNVFLASDLVLPAHDASPPPP